MSEQEWFTEIFGNSAFSVRYSKKLVDLQSDFQRIEIFESVSMGRVLVLNGCFMVTDKDAFIYHEMLVHPAMALLASPGRALVIGGGDGGAVTELTKYPELTTIILCEIDGKVIDSCREFFPDISRGLDDPRVKVVVGDGAAFVRESGEHFDLIVVDSTDPVGPAEVLFQEPFYEAVKQSLRPGGLAVFQTESPLFMEDVFHSVTLNLGAVFGHRSVRPYLATIPCYPGGLWSFTLCSGDSYPCDPANPASFGRLPVALRYYTPDIHRAAFALPAFAQRSLGQLP
ncbi:MAG: polyamine aminopropyltransferase [Desulfomonile sp.]|nr:polyamine aminopropyltransferase [Desulfomonile sp.]